VDQAVALELGPLAGLGFGQLAAGAQGVELLEPHGVGVEGDERVQQVERDVDRFAVAQAAAPGGELVE